MKSYGTSQLIARFCTFFLIPAVLLAKTPADLDAVVERFKIEQNFDVKLDLAYQGLDIYAPLPDKAGTLDRDDRDTLSEMKRLMIISLVKENVGQVLLSAIGSTGGWLIYPDKIRNDFDASKKEEIAHFKHQGLYMEGLSDLDFATMGLGARQYVQRLHEVLAKGRAGHNITPQELEQLEISFLIDEQIADIGTGGSSRKFWKQMLDLGASSAHPEKYITKGGKALYCVEHLGVRGAALIPDENPKTMPFNTWLRFAGQEIGPFTLQYLYGGSCDMDYFMRHAFEKEQTELKTVMQVIKYLERQAWMLEQAYANAAKLPDGLVFRSKHAEGLINKARAIRIFCAEAIDQSTWRTRKTFEQFKEQGLEKSADTCMSAHFLSIRLGYELLWRLDDGDLTNKQAVVLDEIAYDLKTVHEKRYIHGRPLWYDSHETTIVKETIQFLRDYENKKRQEKTEKLLAKAGVIRPKDEMLTTIELGPIPPPPVVVLELDEEVSMEPNAPKAGENVTFSVKGKLHGLLEQQPDWDKAWESPEQKTALEQIGIWSWLASVRRMEISHLFKTDAENLTKKGDAYIYVSPYEIEELLEELEICEDEIIENSKKLGINPPKLETGRFKPNLQPQPTLGSLDLYMKALDKTMKETQAILRTVTSESHAMLQLAQDGRAKGTLPKTVERNIEIWNEINTDAKNTLDKIESGYQTFNTYKGYVESAQKIKGGDFWETANKLRDLEDYLERVADQTETSVWDATRLYNGLDRNVKEFLAQANFEDRKGEHADLFNSMKKRTLAWAKERKAIRVEKLPELQERIKWAKRGAWAASAAKWASRLIAIGQDYKKARDAIQTSDLSSQTSNAVVALTMVGTVITNFADKIPIPALQAAIKDYFSLFTKAPEWSSAFDKLMRYRYQGQGYDVRSVLLPAAYKKLIFHSPTKLSPGQFYRFNGPFGKYNTRLIVFGHPVPDPNDKEEKKLEGDKRYINFKKDQLWLIWDKTNENGYIKLDSELFKKASLYAAWFRRVENRHIFGTELHDFVTKGKYEGGYFDFITREAVVGGTFIGSDMTVEQLRFKAENIRRMEAVKNYLATVAGKSSFSPDEVRHFYAMLDRSARLLAKEGFLMTDHDMKEIMNKIRPDIESKSTFAEILKKLPAFKSGVGAEVVKKGEEMNKALDISAKGVEIYHSLSPIERANLDAAIMELIKKKKKLRREAREKFWTDKTDGVAAGLKLDEIKIAVDHTMLNQTETLTGGGILSPDKDEFTLTWEAKIPEKTEGNTSYMCQVSLLGFEKTKDQVSLAFKLKEQPPPPQPTTSGSGGTVSAVSGESSVQGQKPGSRKAGIPAASIPAGAKKYETKNRIYYMLDGKMVGLEQEWWGDDKQRLYKEFLHADEGFWKMYYKNGQLDFLVCFKNGDETYRHGLQESYYEDGTKKSEEIYEENEWCSQKHWNEKGILTSEGTFDGTNLWNKSYYESGTPYEEVYSRVINGRSVIHGKKIFWFENGQKGYELSYKEGKRHGQGTAWHEDGTNAYEEEHKEGELHGQAVYYHENGKKRDLKSYKDGEPHGPRKEWDEQGNPVREEYYQEGKKHGKDVWYHTNSSQPKTISNYENGKLEGPYTVFDKKGNVIIEGQYVNDFQEGEFRYYNDDGSLRKRDIYKEGRKIKTYRE